MSVGTPERLLASAIKAVFSSSIFLTHHPRTLIQLVLQILAPPTPNRLSYTPLGENAPKPLFDFNPSTTAALINSGTLALLKCGSIPMTGVTCAVAIGIVGISHNGIGTHGEKGTATNRVMVLDPEESEVASLIGGGVFAIHFSRRKESLSRSSAPKESIDVKGEVAWCSWEGLFVEKEFIEAQALATEGAKRVLQTFKSTLAGERAGADEETEEGVNIDR
jgi:exosome complex component RRP46